VRRARRKCDNGRRLSRRCFQINHHK
jgi:hypothetical protein